MIVRKFDLPFDQRWLTDEEAASLGLALLPVLADKMDVTNNNLQQWSIRYSDFPAPVAQRYGQANHNGHFYSAHEVFTWAAKALANRRVYGPRRWVK